MTRVILCDKAGNITLFDDPNPADTVKLQIISRSWYPKMPELGPAVSVTVRGDTIIVTQEDPPQNKAVTSIPKISPKEMSVLQGHADGLSQKEIAARTGISPRMVKEYTERLKEKFNSPSIPKITAQAVRMGIL